MTELHIEDAENQKIFNSNKLATKSNIWRTHRRHTQGLQCKTSATSVK